jgi:hypothetical protein
MAPSGPTVISNGYPTGYSLIVACGSPTSDTARIRLKAKRRAHLLLEQRELNLMKVLRRDCYAPAIRSVEAGRLRAGKAAHHPEITRGTPACVARIHWGDPFWTPERWYSEKARTIFRNGKVGSRIGTFSCRAGTIRHAMVPISFRVFKGLLSFIAGF